MAPITSEQRVVTVELSPKSSPLRTVSPKVRIFKKSFRPVCEDLIGSTTLIMPDTLSAAWFIVVVIRLIQVEKNWWISKSVSFRGNYNELVGKRGLNILLIVYETYLYLALNKAAGLFPRKGQASGLHWQFVLQGSEQPFQSPPLIVIRMKDVVHGSGGFCLLQSVSEVAF